jgi:KUP system potassium uptake protein
VLATLATIIASQAVISATFSLTKQAVLLDLLPKLPIIQTSSEEKGQVYVPVMNFILALGTISFVVYFKNSSAMAYAYGIAVNLVMLSVTLLLTFVAYKLWHWSMIKMAIFFSIIFLIEFGFLGANLEKIISGGWLPILFAVLGGMIMTTWYKGLAYLRKTIYTERGDIRDHLVYVKTSDFHILPNSLAIIITDVYDKSGGSFLQHVKLNQIMAKTNLILSVFVENYPYTDDKERYECVKLDENIYHLILHMGFMQLINIPDELANASNLKIIPFVFDKSKATYFIENTIVSPGPAQSTLTFYWQEKLFCYLMRNSTLDIEFYHLPYHQTISIGCYFEL